jgi:amino-acid N-acetyltransferase
MTEAMRELAFRSASSQDLEAIERLLNDSALPVAGVADLLAADATQFIVATDASRPGELLAVAGLETCGKYALLRSVAVRPDLQHRRLGSDVVQHALREADSRGIQALYLLTLTAEDYFPRFGFRRIAREQVPEAIAGTLEFREACPASAVVMTRDSRGPSPSSNA